MNKLIAILGLSVANYIYALCYGDFGRAIEHTYFQIIAIIGLWFIERGGKTKIP